MEESPEAADALLATLDATKFWLAEDYDNRDEMRAAVARNGVVALFDSPRFVMLDAEQLAEDGILDVLVEIGPQLRHRGVSVNDMRTVEADGETYVVEVNGKTYTVYTPPEANESWGLALAVFVEIVNDLLPDHVEDRFYAIGGGNDGSGAFLPPDVVPFFSHLDALSRPYIPTRTPPDFGSPS